MKHATTSDHRILDFSGGYIRDLSAALVCATVALRWSSLLARSTDGSVFSILVVPSGRCWGRIELKTPPKMDDMKRGTVRQERSRPSRPQDTTLELCGGRQRYLQLRGGGGVMQG